MIAVFPERALPTFALVIFLGNAACNQLHALRYDVLPPISDQEMDVTGCHYVVEHRQAEPLLRFKNPMQVTAPITRKR
jgi:hypothetical protein